MNAPIAVVDLTALRSPFAADGLERTDAELLASVLRAVADPVRLKLINMVAHTDGLNASQLIESVGLSQPTVSHHLRTLVAAGLLTAQKQGVHHIFSIAPDAFTLLSGLLRVPQRGSR